MREDQPEVARWRAVADRVLLLAALALLWEFGVRIFNVKPYLLPAFSTVIASLWRNGWTLFEQSLTTAGEIVLGYLAAVIGGVLISIAIFLWPTANRMLYPVVVLFQGLPKIALAPLIIIWIGYGIASKVLMAFLFAFFPVVISMLGGLSGTPHNLVEHFRAIRAGSWPTFFRLRLPSALPSIMDGCKTAMALCVIGAVVGEFVGASPHIKKRCGSDHYFIVEPW